MRTVKELLDVKGYDIWAVAQDVSVYEAVELMADKNVGAVLVIDAGNLVGVLSERDCARRIILEDKPSKDTLVTEIMTERVLCVRSEQTVEECMALMTDKRVRHLPVLEDEELIGLISIGDVVKSVISEREFMIEQLENYITGWAFRPRRT